MAEEPRSLRERLDIALQIDPTITDERLVALIVQRMGFADGMQLVVSRLPLPFPPPDVEDPE